jgi:prepilin-type N-terminal cleavage/methylation domain-containing protein
MMLPKANGAALAAPAIVNCPLSIVHCPLSISPSFAAGSSRRQRGFSMVEMLAAAFILAIGILGIVMLQAISLKASRGSANMGTAARVAGRVVDRAELEGRLSRLNITDSDLAAPSLDHFGPNFFKYINKSDDVTEEFNIKGGPVEAESDDPTLSVPFFTVVTTRVDRPTGSASLVKMSDFQVRVTFADNVDATKAPIPRTFNLTRRIIHG